MRPVYDIAAVKRLILERLAAGQTLAQLEGTAGFPSAPTVRAWARADAGFAAGGRVLAKGRDALAELVGGGSKGCKTKLVWTDWSHLMLNHEITATPDGAKGRVYLVQLGMKGPGTIERHGGYEDTYVRTAEGWRIKQRVHVRDKAWHAPALQTPDLN